MDKNEAIIEIRFVPDFDDAPDFVVRAIKAWFAEDHINQPKVTIVRDPRLTGIYGSPEDIADFCWREHAGKKINAIKQYRAMMADVFNQHPDLRAAKDALDAAEWRAR